MRAFYEACENAIDAKTQEDTLHNLTKADALMQPIVQQARSRLELRLASDLVEHLRWTHSWLKYKATLASEDWPGFCGPLGGFSLGTTYVYPPTPVNRTSLDYRWGKHQDWNESYLPSVPWNQKRFPFPKNS